MMTLPRKEAYSLRDGLHRPPAQVALIHHGDHAEVAAMRAAARGEQHAGRVVAPVEQVLPGHRRLLKRRRFRGAVARAMAAGLKLGQELRPLGFGFPDEDHVGVRLRFFGQQGDMRAAQYHGVSPLPEAAGQGVGVGRARGVEGDRHQIGRRVKVDRLRRFIHVQHRPMGRRKRGQVGHRDLLEVQHPGAPHPLNLRGRSGYQEEGGRMVRHRFRWQGELYETVSYGLQHLTRDTMAESSDRSNCGIGEA